MRTARPAQRWQRSASVGELTFPFQRTALSCVRTPLPKGTVRHRPAEGRGPLPVSTALLTDTERPLPAATRAPPAQPQPCEPLPLFQPPLNSPEPRLHSPRSPANPSGPTHRHHSATATPPFARAQLRRRCPQARAPFPPLPAARALFKASARLHRPFLRRRSAGQQRWAVRLGPGGAGSAAAAGWRSLSEFREAWGRTNPGPCPAHAAPEGGRAAGRLAPCCAAGTGRSAGLGWLQRAVARWCCLAAPRQSHVNLGARCFKWVASSLFVCFVFSFKALSYVASSLIWRVQSWQWNESDL